jgi:hypothetical protein
MDGARLKENHSHLMPSGGSVAGSARRGARRCTMAYTIPSILEEEGGGMKKAAEPSFMKIAEDSQSDSND